MRALTLAVRHLARDTRGVAMIELAFLTPVLALLALGAYDTSRMISRQSELQSGAAESQEIILSVNQGEETDPVAVKAILLSSTGLAQNELNVEMKYRCGASTTLVTTRPTCTAGSVLSTYLMLTLTDIYTPTWTKFGIGRPFNYNIVRTVQLS